jgi:UDP-N-acetylglucosamine transferase subunit ALG13
MIFVTVGVAPYYGFDRLINEMDRIAGEIDEKVVMQIGNTRSKPKNAEFFSFTSNEEIERLYKNARVIVSHSGAGSIITATQYGKPIIVVPRMKKYGEYGNDHQLEIADAFAREGKIKVVYDVKDLEKTLQEVTSSLEKIERDKRLVNFLKSYLDDLEKSLEKKGFR